MCGWIKLHRKFLNWEWYSDINVRVLFVHCLLKANHETKSWQGQIIGAGQFVTSFENLAIETGLTVRKIRTALNKLKTTGELTSKTTSKYSIITIKNWNEYQTNDKQIDKQTTNERQASDKQMTTTKEVKNERSKEEKKSVLVNNNLYTYSLDTTHTQKEVVFKPYGEYSNVYLTDTQRRQVDMITMDKKSAIELIDELSINIARDKAPVFNENKPDIHLAYLQAYWRYKRKNHRTHTEEMSNEELVRSICGNG